VAVSLDLRVLFLLHFKLRYRACGKGLGMGKKGKVGLAAVAALVLCTNAGVAEAKQQTNTLVPERNNALVPDGQCAIQVASRRTLEESVAFIDTLRPNFTEIRVFRAENGWHAISVGLYSIEQGAQATQDFVERGLIPADSFCYTGYAAGRAYVAEVDWLALNSAEQGIIQDSTSAWGLFFNPNLYYITSLNTVNIDWTINSCSQLAQNSAYSPAIYGFQRDEMVSIGLDVQSGSVLFRNTNPATYRTYNNTEILVAATIPGVRLGDTVVEYHFSIIEDGYGVSFRSVECISGQRCNDFNFQQVLLSFNENLRVYQICSDAP
jgi:hypothetical protein